ncbi:ABC transporter substrate-binding protein [Staphylococcus sp. GSSP0090]|nr:ABC transporter substrate-binding protein [Staphylococcus sp. GSSP0090]
MKKALIFLIMVTLLLSACSNNDKSESKQDDEMTTFKAKNGKKYKVPKNPKRVAVLPAFYVGDFIELGIKPVAVSELAKESSIIKPHVKGVPLIGEDDVEKVANQKPDLIVADAQDKNIKKYEKIAPTVPFEYTDYNHQEILKELGKLTNKEKTADEWVTQWDKKTKKDREDIQKVIGKDATASVFEVEEKGLSIFDSNWGRGTDIVHNAFGMKTPEAYKDKLKEKGKGYQSISKESIDQYAGDYIFLSSPKYGNFDFEKTRLWQQLPAVKNDRVIKYQAEDYWFTDPITLEHLRKKLKDDILEKAQNDNE